MPILIKTSKWCDPTKKIDGKQNKRFQEIAVTKWQPFTIHQVTLLIVLM